MADMSHQEGAERTPLSQRRMSRRGFLRGAVAVAAATGAGAVGINCGPNGEPITPEPIKTAPPLPTVTPRPTETPTPTATNTPKPNETPIGTETPTVEPTQTPVETETPSPTPEPTPVTPEVEDALKKLPYEVGWSGEFKDPETGRTVVFAVAKKMMDPEIRGKKAITGVKFNPQFDNPVGRLIDAIDYGRYRAFITQLNPNRKTDTFEKNEADFRKFQERERKEGAILAKPEIYGRVDDKVSTTGNVQENIERITDMIDWKKPVIISITPDEDRITSVTFSTAGLGWGYRVSNDRLILEVRHGGIGHGSSLNAITGILAQSIYYLGETSKQKEGLITRFDAESQIGNLRDIYETFLHFPNISPPDLVYAIN